jgi:hypothetical protein
MNCVADRISNLTESICDAFSGVKNLNRNRGLKTFFNLDFAKNTQMDCGGHII